VDWTMCIDSTALMSQLTQFVKCCNHRYYLAPLMDWGGGEVDP